VPANGMSEPKPNVEPSDMKSPAYQKGKAAPPPLDLSKYQKVEAPEEPIPLVRRKKQELELPPREEVVPKSIKGMLPPIRDNGKQIQVGTEQNPGAAPRNDIIRTKKTPSKEKNKLSLLKQAALKSKNPKDIEAYKKELTKDVINKKKTTSKK